MPFDRSLARNPVLLATAFSGDRDAAAAVGATVGAAGTPPPRVDEGSGAAVETGTMCATGFNLRTFLTGFRTLATNLGRLSAAASSPPFAAAASGVAVTGRVAPADSVVCRERTFTTGRLNESAAAAAGAAALVVGLLLRTSPPGVPNLMWAKDDSVGGALLCSSGSVVRRGGTAGTGLRWVPRAKDVVGKSSVDVVVVTASCRRKGDRLG